MSYQKRAEFRNMLIPTTLRHAAKQVPAYAQLLPYLQQVKAIEHLSLLPLVDKDAMLLESKGFRDSTQKTALVQHTTGTSGRSLVIHRSTSEIDFITRFYTSTINTVSSNFPLCISLVAHFHGMLTPFPYPGPVLPLDVQDADRINHLPAIIQRPWDYLDVEESSVIISGLESNLRLLTCLLIEQNFDFSSAKVIAIHSTGDIITDRLRKWYETTWKAPLVNRYSMTEMNGGATLCNRCGQFHLDPHLIGELITIHGHEPISSGTGLLVVTCLFPFIQKQPFIRYITGDLIQVEAAKCEVDSFGFSYKGRAASAAMNDSIAPNKLLISGSDLFEVLDSIQDISSDTMFTSVKGVSDHTALGHVKCSLSCAWLKDVFQITIGIETRYSPYMYPVRIHEIKEEIKSRLLHLSPPLRELYDAGQVHLRIETVPLGTLPRFVPDIVE